VLLHERARQRCALGSQVSPVAHSPSATQPVVHVRASAQLQRIGSQIMPEAGPPQSMSVVQLPGSLLHAPQPGGSVRRRHPRYEGAHEQAKQMSSAHSGVVRHACASSWSHDGNTSSS